MGVASTEQRRGKRRFVHTGGTLFTADTASLAWIKDISDSGICLYTQHTPNIGDTVQIRLYPQKDPSGLQEQYEGIVIRVQTSGAGAAFGVAIRFNQMETLLRKSA